MRRIGYAALAVAASWAGAAPAADSVLPGLYKAGPGPHAIASVPDLVVHDPARAKDLPVNVTYPKGEGHHPAIVFSHGAWASNTYYYQLADHWASHGFVVVQPTHEDSIALGQTFGDEKVFALGMTRVIDDTFLVTNINALGIEDLDGRIDENRIGLGGHSYGANTAMLMGGLTVFDGEGKGRSVGDPRLKAIFVLSGQGLGEGRTPESYKSIDKPMLVVTGSKDRGRAGQPVDWRVDPYTYAEPPDKYLLFIEEADHSFGALTNPRPPERTAGRDLPVRPTHAAMVMSVSTAFFDAYLNGSEDARAFLRSGAVSAESAGEGRLDFK